MKTLFSSALFCCIVLGVSAQQSRPTLQVGYTESAVKADGKLDEADWSTAPVQDQFKTTVPVQAGTPSLRTTLRVLAHDRFIVFGIECEDNPALLTNFSKLRDADLDNEDYLRVIIDPFQDGQSGYIFMINPSAARYDALVSNRGESESKDWDGIWEAGTSITENGWTAEIKIPMQSINFRKGLKEWAFNVERNIQRKLEVIRWANPSRDQWFTQTSRAGLITDLPDFSYGVGMNIRPSLIGNWTNEAGAGTDFDFTPTLTLSQRLSPNAIATATFNTDFAETEVDTRQANLTRFALFFPEKRAFFLEGSDIFEFGFGLRRDVVPFFSRRIGLLSGNPIPIVAGGKVNGRVDRTSFGGLVMNTAETNFEDATDPITIPNSTMGVFRLKQNILRESSVGVFGSFGDPSGGSGSGLFGADFTYQTTRFNGNKNFLAGLWSLYNEREGSTGDQSAYGFKLDYPNDIWDASITYVHVGDGFNPALGFVPRKGINKWVVGTTWAPRPEWGWLRQMRNQLFGTYITDLAGQWQTYRVFTAPINWRLESGERIEFNVIPQGERIIEPFEISDGVTIPVGTYEFVRYRLEGDIAAKRKLNGRLSWRFGSFYQGNLNEYQLRINWIPASILSFEFAGTRNVASLPFGDFDQTLLGLRVRFNATPDLQLNSFVQYDTDSESIGINSRIHWIFDPQGEFFLVFNNSSVYDDINNRFQRQTSQLILKLRYNFRF